MDAGDRSTLLKGWAVEAGFDRAGVARVERSADGEALLAWIDAGRHAGMGYMARRVEERLDPGRLVPGALSALVVARQYHPPRDGAEPSGDLWPRVARYARGDDYHLSMGRDLDRLAERVETAFPGTRHRRYVDTGPVLERELAARAGLGAVGKNTNLLHPEAGSWFLLGELFLSLELEPDQPLADLCGSCSRCLEACPTGALPAPYVLDSRRCISYWTIEHRGPIPEELRDELGGWVFGCDVCQEVCPLNDRPAAAAGAEFDPAPGRAGLDLASLLAMGRDEYVERFRGSAMKRARLDGLRRNTALAMGESGDRRYVEPLGAALDDDDPVVRGHAAWALGRVGGGRAVELLRDARERETDASARADLERALGRISLTVEGPEPIL